LAATAIVDQKANEISRPFSIDCVHNPLLLAPGLQQAGSFELR
jgi:hypothetical protein